MRWNRRLVLLAAVAVLGVAGALTALWPRGTMPDAAALPAEQALPEVLAQVYRAFALEDEAAIYDALAGAVEGDLITQLYLQRRAAQVANHAEDGEATILGVEVYEVTPGPVAGDAHAFSVAWRVIGRLRHIAHIHERINLYTADLVLAPRDGVWKLTGFTLTNSARDADMNFEGGE